ncbi:MAG TPA: cytochrome c oxidase subunit II [Gammaproteobacteria bacterium]|nr:cytochrome c oxidase subunit II [Gammaproteobacteria bacterium]
MKLVNKKLAARAGALATGLLTAGSALADFELNMTPGASGISREVYSLHMLILWICVAIGILVFGAIIYSVIKFRRSKGAVAAQFHHSTTVEIVWTIIPMLILIAIAIPATRVLVEMEDTSNADLTIKVTGYQWRWGYDYLDEGISFISSLDPHSNLARQRNPTIQPRDVENYLLEVDNPLVLPVGKKVRFLLTSDDVIHSWWVPALGWKRDAIPGYINEKWTRLEQPGIYRGQCAELCGRDHAFMPIVLRAVPEDEYRAWVQEQKAKSGQAQQQGTAQPPSQPQPAPQQPAAAVAPQQQPAVQQVAALAQFSKDELMQRGEQAYVANCASCHMANGEGMPPMFKPLKGSPVVTGAVAAHLEVVLRGRPGTAMTAFAHLSDEDLAAIITYKRNAWGNNVGDLIQPADVRAAR